MKQPVPSAWKKALFEEAGIQPVVYEVGNEIDFGICGVYAEGPERYRPNG